MRQHIFGEINAERDRQEAKIGPQRHDWAVRSAIPSEESGEVAEACLQSRTK